MLLEEDETREASFSEVSDSGGSGGGRNVRRVRREGDLPSEELQSNEALNRQITDHRLRSLRRPTTKGEGELFTFRQVKGHRGLARCGFSVRTV